MLLLAEVKYDNLPRWPVLEKETEVSRQFRKEQLMKTLKKLSICGISAVMLVVLGGCANMSQRDKNTAVGAGIGAVGGAVLTGGSAIGTVGGAAVGGVIGNQIGR